MIVRVIAMQRWILHVDMDAFYASVEQRDRPELRGRPVIVGGTGSRGVVATASYEARRFGVRSAMPMGEARRICPESVVLPGDHRKYARVARQIREIMHEFSPLVEPLSLDEAFLDVTGMEWIYPDIRGAAVALKRRIRDELELTASAGLATNKFLAKIASDIKKPDGLVVVRPGEEEAFLRDLPVRRIWGVGDAAAGQLHQMGIVTIGQLRGLSPELLKQRFGKAGTDMAALARGIDDRPVIPDQVPKSLGKEYTFETDLSSPDEIRTQLLLLAGQVGWRLRRTGCFGRTVTLKVRFASFRTITRSKTLSDPTQLDDTLFRTAVALWEGIPLSEGVRLLGITVSHLGAGCEQVDLFGVDEKKTRLAAATDHLKARFGEFIVTRGRLAGKLPEDE